VCDASISTHCSKCTGAASADDHENEDDDDDDDDDDVDDDDDDAICLHTSAGRHSAKGSTQKGQIVVGDDSDGRLAKQRRWNVCFALHVSTPASVRVIDFMHSAQRALHSLDLRGRFAAGASMLFVGASPTCCTDAAAAAAAAADDDDVVDEFDGLRFFFVVADAAVLAAACSASCASNLSISRLQLSRINSLRGSHVLSPIGSKPGLL
jgi:hypothetical protein